LLAISQAWDEDKWGTVEEHRIFGTRTKECN